MIDEIISSKLFQICKYFVTLTQSITFVRKKTVHAVTVQNSEAKTTYVSGFLYCCCDENKVKMARKPGKKQKENLVGYIGEGEFHI